MFAGGSSLSYKSLRVLHAMSIGGGMIFWLVVALVANVVALIGMHDWAGHVARR